MIKIRKKNIIIALVSITLVSLILLSIGIFNQASAAELLPEPIVNLMNLLGDEGEGTSEFAASRIRLLLLLGLGGLILAAVIYAGLAAFKYIRSQGDPSQIEEAGKAVKAVFLGLAVLLISIVGIVLIFVFFGIDLFDTSTYQTCISAPGSEGCLACQNPNGGLDDNWDNIKFDNSSTFDSALMADPSNNPKRLCTQCEWEYFRNARGAGLVIDSKCEE